MSRSKKTLSIEINSKKIVATLFIAAGVLLLGHLTGMLAKFVFHHSNVFGLVPLFDLDKEKNIPTFFQTSVLLLNAFLLLFITVLERKNKTKPWHYFLVLTIGFFYMALDEWFQFHERLINPIYHWLGIENLGVFTFAWIFVGILVVILAGFYFYRFLAQMEQKNRRNFILAAVVYISGTIGVEMIGGYVYSAKLAATALYAAVIACEETLEMVGMILMLRALLKYSEAHYSLVNLELAFPQRRTQPISKEE
jgi:hypothetical protein